MAAFVEEGRQVGGGDGKDRAWEKRATTSMSARIIRKKRGSELFCHLGGLNVLAFAVLRHFR
jgi:hypothetical protein